MPRPTILCVELLLEWWRSLPPTMEVMKLANQQGCQTVKARWPAAWGCFFLFVFLIVLERKFFCLFVSANLAASSCLHTYCHTYCQTLYISLEVVFFGIPSRLPATVERWRWRLLQAGTSEIECCRFCRLRMRRPNQCGYAATPII